jgi:hypothetical protein
MIGTSAKYKKPVHMYTLSQYVDSTLIQVINQNTE